MKNNKILEKQSIELTTPDAFELSDRLTGRRGIVRANAVTTTLVRVIYNDKIHNDTSIKDMVSKENETINEKVKIEIVKENKLNNKFITTLKDFILFNESNNLNIIWTLEDADKLKEAINTPFKNCTLSTLGGPNSKAIMIVFSLQPKEQWSHGILENSDYARFHLDYNGVLEMFSGNLKRKFGINFRKTRVKNIDDAISKINKYIQDILKTINTPKNESIITNVNSTNIVNLIKNELLLHKNDSYYDNSENDKNFNIIWGEFEKICNPTEHEVDTIVYGLDNNGIKATTEELYEWMLNKLASCGINESTNDPRTEDKFKSDLFNFLDYPWNKHIETSIVEELNKNRETYVTANENTLKSMLKSLFAKHNKNIMKEGSDLFKFNVKKLTENFNK